LLYLNACFLTLGRNISEHLTVVRGAYCTLGYVVTPRFAARMLGVLRRAAALGRGAEVDRLYNVGGCCRGCGWGRSLVVCLQAHRRRRAHAHSRVRTSMRATPACMQASCFWLSHLNGPPEHVLSGTRTPTLTPELTPTGPDPPSGSGCLHRAAALDTLRVRRVPAELRLFPESDVVGAPTGRVQREAAATAEMMAAALWLLVARSCTTHCLVRSIVLEMPHDMVHAKRRYAS
jgi:hypothetical protein